MSVLDKDFKSNSHKSREKETENKNGKVISGSAKLKSQPFLQKITEGIMSNFIRDVVMPSLKRGIYDVIVNGADMVFGDEKSKNTAPKSYGKYFVKSNRTRTEESRGTDNYRNIIFEKKADANSVLDRLIELIDMFGVASVSDLYQAADISSDNYAFDPKYGWADLRGSRVVLCRDGYMLKLPKALPLDDLE